ncbi:hypothetical protein GX645_05795 [Candidatus Sumerlaeota bacterium]|nr:hypothetical protein [Candidatus Sumerlaeales bacterium]NLD61949.1 hypothetical protein [Candidatus Sumerlaeota bacterium]
MDVNETRKLQKLLKLNQEQVYHVFCLALAMGVLDGDMEPNEAEMLTRIGMALGLKPQDIEVISKNAHESIKETSISDLLAYSITRLKQLLTSEQLEGVVMILDYMAHHDTGLHIEESEVVNIAKSIWFGDDKKKK